MGETWAFVFLPLILLALTKLIKSATNRHLAFFALSLSGLLLTHNLSAMMFVPFAAIWIVVFIIIDKNNQQPVFPSKLEGMSRLWRDRGVLSTLIEALPRVVIGGLLAAAIAAFFFLPIVFETRFAHTDSLLSGYFNYLAHFVDLRQLFATSFWGYGSSEIGFTDDLSYFYGIIHLSFGCSRHINCPIPQVFSSKLEEKSRRDRGVLVLTSVLIFFAATFLAHEKSTLSGKHCHF
jgi:hypothetical protein